MHPRTTRPVSCSVITNNRSALHTTIRSYIPRPCSPHEDHDPGTLWWPRFPCRRDATGINLLGFYSHRTRRSSNRASFSSRNFPSKFSQVASSGKLSRADVNWSLGVGERARILPEKAIIIRYPVRQTYPFPESGFRRLRYIIEHAWVWPVLGKLGKSGPSQRRPYFWCYCYLVLV